MLVLTPWQGRTIAVPLSQLIAIDPDESTEQGHEELKQIVAVRGEADCMNSRRLREALGGAVRRDAAFFRMSALAMEQSDDDDDLPDACEFWDKFCEEAVREGWFRLTASRRPRYISIWPIFAHGSRKSRLANIVSRPSAKGPAHEEDCYFLFPEKLYARACTIDPHPEVFAQWMRWAASESASRAENVAREWHRIRPDDFSSLCCT